MNSLLPTHRSSSFPAGVAPLGETPRPHSSLTPSLFLANYDEFQSLEESKIQAAIDEAIAFVPIEVWGARYKQAVFLIAAHILAMRWLQVGAIAANAVQNAKGRDASNRMDSESWLTGTVWGQQFLQLRRSLPVSGFVI